MNNYTNYAELLKPTWAPPAAFWSCMERAVPPHYAYFVWESAVIVRRKGIPFVVALPFLLNIVFNLLFTPLQFGLKNLTLASVDVVLVLVTLIWAMVAIYPYAKWIAYMQIPYVLWVSFATVLQITVTVMNAISSILSTIMKTIIISILRIALGFIFLWAFVDKLLGLGFATTTQKMHGSMEGLQHMGFSCTEQKGLLHTSFSQSQGVLWWIGSL